MANTKKHRRKGGLGDVVINNPRPKSNKTLLIVGSLAAIGTVVFFVLKNKSKTTVTDETQADIITKAKLDIINSEISEIATNLTNKVSQLVNSGTKSAIDQAQNLVDIQNAQNSVSNQQQQTAAELFEIEMAKMQAKSEENERARQEAEAQELILLQQQAALDAEKKKLAQYEQSLLDNLNAGGRNYEVNGKLYLFPPADVTKAQYYSQKIKNDVGKYANGGIDEKLYTDFNSQTDLIIWLSDKLFETELDNTWGKPTLQDTLMFQTWSKADSKPVVSILNKLAAMGVGKYKTYSVSYDFWGAGTIKGKN
jgi:hypothetical protein